MPATFYVAVQQPLQVPTSSPSSALRHKFQILHDIVHETEQKFWRVDIAQNVS